MKRLSARNIVLFFVLGLFIISCKNQENKNSGDTIPKLPIIIDNYSSLTSYGQMMNYLKKVSALSKNISMNITGESVEGREIPLIKISNEENIAKEKVNIFLFAQQHGDEPSGKEALLMLIDGFANGQNQSWLKKVNLLLIPQVNPDGGEKNKRKNANGDDLNRDHLVLQNPETRAVHKVFNKYLPEVTVDIHEYDPYSDYWKEFGYQKNFDIQLGFLTNLNVDKKLTDLFYKEILPYVEEDIESRGYSFFEYTLGDFPAGKRLRHSTVDINDGRQSLGILNSLSFIVEGKYGKDSVENLETRTLSQCLTAKSIIEYSVKNSEMIDSLVYQSRKKLRKASQGEKVAIRMNHVKGNKNLKYPLKSLTTGKDTVFVVENFHSKVVSLLDVEKPSGYLIPVNDKKLVSWLKRSYLKYSKYHNKEEYTVNAYRIKHVSKSYDEGLENYYPEVKLISYTNKIKDLDYYYLPIDQLHSNKMALALEPQSMLGLVNYSEFNYLLEKQKIYPVLRVKRN